MKFTSEEFKKFRKSIKEAVASVEKEFNVDIKFGNISYTESSFNMKVEVFNGGIEEAKKAEFAQYCVLYNLKPEDYGKEITYKGKVYTIFGFDMKKRKYPIIIKEKDGESLIGLTEAGIKLLLEKGE